MVSLPSAGEAEPRVPDPGQKHRRRACYPGKRDTSGWAAFTMNLICFHFCRPLPSLTAYLPVNAPIFIPEKNALMLESDAGPSDATNNQRAHEDARTYTDRAH